MQHFELTHIINNKELEDKLEDLEKRCKTINGWNKKDLLQYAVSIVPLEKIWITYLEDMVSEIENEKKQNSIFKDLYNRFKDKNRLPD